jgi:hypothetical protein
MNDGRGRRFKSESKRLALIFLSLLVRFLIVASEELTHGLTMKRADRHYELGGAPPGVTNSIWLCS